MKAHDLERLIFSCYSENGLRGKVKMQTHTKKRERGRWEKKRYKQFQSGPQHRIVAVRSNCTLGILRRRNLNNMRDDLGV